jgi:hypothetical protein
MSRFRALFSLSPPDKALLSSVQGCYQCAMGILGLRWSLFLLITSQVILGACSSAKSSGSDGAAGSGGGSGTGGGGGGSAGGAAGGTSGASGSDVATMFLSDGISSAVYRYALRPGVDPVLNDTITVTAPGGTGAQSTAAGMAMSSAGELFVADLSTGGIFRFLSPLGTPTANGSAVVAGITTVAEIRFVDDELWVPNVTAATCSTTPESIVRVGFDAQGTASLAGTVTAGSIGANRGMLWAPATRDLYIAQCDPVDTVQHYRIAADDTATLLTPITGNGLNNPNGLVLTPWGELLVANAGLAGSPGMALLRFTLDSQGNATANGTIPGNGLNLPIGLAFAPWGELFAVNQGTGTISRFTFDSAHAAVANGTFPIPGPTVPQMGGLGWILIVPGASSAVDGGIDAASD